MRPIRLPVILRVYVIALLALMFGIAAGVFSNGWFFTAQPYQINYGEGLVAWQAAHITDPEHTYVPIDRYPFLVFQYPPLFHLVTRAVGGDLVTAGRQVSLACAALLCAVIGWITFQTLPRRTGWRARLFAAAFAAALPTTLYNFHWMWLARVDTLAILLSFSGAMLFAARITSTPAQILAAVLMIAALFARQTALAAPLACLLVALVIDRRIAGRMLVTMLILGAAVLGWLSWWSHGQVLLHLFRYNQNAFSISRAAFGILMNTRHIGGLLVLGGGAAVGVLASAWTLARRRRWGLLGANLRTNPFRRVVFLLAVYSAFAALSGLTFGKEGSDVNYFLEWNLTLAPLVGMLLFRATGPARLRVRPEWLAALAIPVLLLGTGIDQARDGWLRFFRGPMPADREQMDVYRRMTAVMEQAHGPVFSEDMNLLYKAGKDIPAEPAMIQCLAAAGMWDERPFLRMIQNRSFPLIVAYDLASRERYSPAVAGAIEQNYEQAAMIGEYRLYRPRPGGAQRP